VGFLDDLKRQADARKSQQDRHLAALARNTASAEAACKTIFSYFNTLVDQLAVLKPVSPARFVLDRQHVFEKLPLSDFRVDARASGCATRSSRVHPAALAAADRPQVQIMRTSWARSRSSSRGCARARPSRRPGRARPGQRPAAGPALHLHRRFPRQRAGHAEPRHGRLHFQLHNLDGFESISVDFPADDFGTAKLDEMARWLSGSRTHF